MNISQGTLEGNLEPSRLSGSVPELRGLGAEALEALVAAAAGRRLEPGELLFRIGEPAGSLFLLLDGALDVVVSAGEEEVRLAELASPAMVGELGLLRAAVRSATVRAREACVVLELTAPDFWALARRYPELREAGFAMLRRRLPALVRVPDGLLGELETDAQAPTGSTLAWIRLRRGEVLFRSGDPGDALYVLLSGRLQVVAEEGWEPGTPGEVALGEVTPGESVGEMALLTGNPRSATVRAQRDSDLLGLSREGFDRLLEREPRALLPTIRGLATRLLERSGRPRRRSVPCLAVVPLEDDALALELATALAARSFPGEGARILTAAAADAALGPGVADSPRDGLKAVALDWWLEEAQRTSRLTIAVGETGKPAWNERCFQHADRVLLVARPSNSARGPSRDLLERHRRYVPVDLVLVHPRGGPRPSGTARWREALGVEFQHHLRDGDAPSLDRLARFVSGRSVGLVLGGGGAKGFAHAGVLRALQERGVPIDFVGGTSIGSLAAATCAFGLGPEEMREVFRRIFVATRSDRRLTVPVVSFLSSAGSDRALDETFGSVQIEDLEIPFFCVSTNLSTARAHVHREGSLCRAVRSSSSIPGLVPPVTWKGEIFVDGGLVDNLPVGAMSRYCPGPLIAVDVTPDRQMRVDENFLATPGPVELLASRLPGRRKLRFPGLPILLGRSIETAGLVLARSRPLDADLVLRPPISRFGMTDVYRLDEIVEVGYHHAREALETLPADFPCCQP